jgi:hypothetical protein
MDRGFLRLFRGKMVLYPVFRRFDMSHHAHPKNDALTGKVVIFSLLLFFALTVAGHYVFVMSNEGPETQEHFVKVDHEGGKVIVNPETAHKKKR